MKLLLTVLALYATLAIFPSPASADDTNVLFIVDASGSMKKSVGDKTRMDAAKDVLNKTLGEMPKEVNLGLLAYGHRTAKNCSDIELVSALGATNAQGLQKTVKGLNALGETPIAQSLLRAAAEFDSSKGQVNKIILVTDGLEECGGDPCAAAQAIKNKGVDVAVDVVGFTLGAEEAKAVQCIADTTGGKVYTAANAQALTQALKEATQPQTNLVFEDTFDSEDHTAAMWTIKNEDDETYLVEDGSLLMISNKEDLTKSPYAPNSFKINQALPKGDWVMNIVFEPENSSDAFFGVTFGDLENSEKIKRMAAGSFFNSRGAYPGVYTGFWLTNGDKKTNENRLLAPAHKGYPGVAEALKVKGSKTFELEISRQKRIYVMRIRAADVADSKWQKVAEITVLRPFKTMQLQLRHNQYSNGAQTFKVDSVTIHTVE